MISFTIEDPSLNDTIECDYRPIDALAALMVKQALAKLFREAVSDLAAEHVDHDDPAATTAADELLALLADPTNVRFQYSGLPLDGRALTPGQLIADINVSLSSGISEPLKYGIQLRSGCVAARPFRKFLLLVGLIRRSSSVASVSMPSSRSCQCDHGG